MSLGLFDKIINQFKLKKIEPVIVLGMHRSGTSCLTGLLEESGVYLGEVSKYNPFNVKGNHENNEIVALNDSVLNFNNLNWHSPPSLQTELSWNTNHEDTREKIISSFAESSINDWGFKDPRIVITLPFWLDSLNSPRFIGTFRHPLSVAKSIHNRNKKFEIDYGIEVWHKYNERLLEYYNKKEFPLVSFDVEGRQYLKSFNRCLEMLGLPQIDRLNFFDDNLRHNKEIDNHYQLPLEVSDVYNELVEQYNKQEKA